MRKLVSAAFALALLGGSVVVAEAKGGRCGPRTPRINQRQHNQQQRIFGGVRSGELTRGEFWRLERNAREIRQDERQARADGVVTARERAELHRELNQESRMIYRAKHNEKDRN